MNLFLNVLAISSIEIKFAIDILNHKHVSNGILFHCYNNNISNNVYKLFNQHNIKIATKKITMNSSYYISPYCCGKSAVIINATCEGWTAVLDSNILAFQNYSFIIITNDWSSIKTILPQYPIQVDSDVTVAHETNSKIYLYEVYNTGLHNNGTFNAVKVGHWCSLNTLHIENYDRKNLQGLKVTIAVVILPTQRPVNITVEQYMEKASIKADTVHKMKFFILLGYMREMFNISYHLLRVNSWGYQRNGTFDGMIGALRNGMADVGGAPCFFRSDRAANVHYISEVWNTKQGFIFRNPKYPGGFYMIYTRPLSNIVWYCVMALLAFTAVITWLMLRLQDNSVKGQDSSLSLASLVIWGAVCQQGMFVRRESASVKLATFVTFVYAVTLYQYYNATIVSSLLMKPPMNIRTLKDLLESDLKVGVEDIVYNKDYLKRTADPVAIELYKRKVHTSTQYNFFKAEDGMALVKQGGFAFHVDTAVGFPIIKETFREREICEIQPKFVQMHPSQKCGVVIRKNAPYKEHISYGIRKMYEAGLLCRIRAVIDTPMPECTHTPDTSLYCVNISEFSTPLLALILGIMCSLLILLTEIITSKIMKVSNEFVGFRR